MSGKPIMLPMRHAINIGLAVGMVVLTIMLVGPKATRCSG
jgi:NAD(P) transhydrogenase subunit beta